MCKILSSEVAERVTSLAVNLFGGYGFVKDYPVEKLYPRREDRADLRGHHQPAAADDREADARMRVWMSRVIGESRGGDSVIRNSADH